jgi:hypothetical protein
MSVAMAPEAVRSGFGEWAHAGAALSSNSETVMGREMYRQRIGAAIILKPKYHIKSGDLTEKKDRREWTVKR